MTVWQQLFTRRMLICVFTGFSSGLPLYLQIVRGASPTEAGLLVVEQARRMADQADEIERRVLGQDRELTGVLEALRTAGAVPLIGNLDDPATLSRLAGLADAVRAMY